MLWYSACVFEFCYFGAVLASWCCSLDFVISWIDGLGCDCLICYCWAIWFCLFWVCFSAVVYICDYDCLVLGLVGVLVWLVLFGYLLLGLVVVDVWLDWVVCCLCLFGFSAIVVVCGRLAGLGCVLFASE